MKVYLRITAIEDGEMLLNSIGFEFTRVTAHKLKNKFIAVVVDWTANSDNSHKVKYCSEGSTSWNSDGSIAVEGIFDSDKKFKYRLGRSWVHPTFEIGVVYGKDKPYDFVKLTNTKYGVCVYFAPRNWNTMAGCKDVEVIQV